MALCSAVGGAAIEEEQEVPLSESLFVLRHRVSGSQQIMRCGMSMPIGRAILLSRKPPPLFCWYSLDVNFSTLMSDVFLVSCGPGILQDWGRETKGIVISYLIGSFGLFL